MNTLETQFERLKSAFPGAEKRQLASGAVLIVLNGFSLPLGWSRLTTTVKFIAPIGYPFAKPDCFWVDSDIRLQSGAMPQNSNISPIPETNENHLWFSWHAGQWNANSDDLVTYVKLIDRRLRTIA
jgi:Prokaryotic E2 family E